MIRSPAWKADHTRWLAAVVGATEISLSQLRAGAAALEPPVDIPVLFDALDRALRLRLLEERGEGYAFRHPVVRAALYDCLPRHRRLRQEEKCR